MRVTYHPLLRIRVRHSWYANRTTLGDFVILPTPSTQRQLESLGLRCCNHNDGISLFTDVEKRGGIHCLARSRARLALQFAFEVRVLNPNLFNVTKLPPIALGRQVLCFDNLRFRASDDRRILGDALGGDPIGEPVMLVGGTTYRHEFSSPVHRAQLTLSDRFARVIERFTFAADQKMMVPNQSPPPGTALLKTCLVDLRKVPGILPGRYVMTDDCGKAVNLYYDPELNTSRPLAVIELFNEPRLVPSQLQPDRTESGQVQIPVSNRFLVDDEFVDGGDYCLELSARATYWRYRIAKRYPTNCIEISALSIAGPAAFEPGTTAMKDRVDFTSNVPLELCELRRDVRLRHADVDIRALPNPNIDTPLDREGTASSTFYSDLFINV